MTAPFLSITDFQTQFGSSLTAGDTAVATRLLEVVSDWIRGQNADVDATAATQVVFEVVRDQLNLGEFSPLSSFNNSTSRRTEAGTFMDDDTMLTEVITNRQKRMLGILLTAAPAYNFPVCDY